WTATLAAATPLVPDAELNPELDTVASARSSSVTLEAQITAALLERVPTAFNTTTADVLLAALVVAAAAWRRQCQSDVEGPILIDVEAHGREPMDSGLDVSRTVGWFTALFPVAFHVQPLDIDDALAGTAAIGRALNQVKEQLRAVPHRGLGYG